MHLGQHQIKGRDIERIAVCSDKMIEMNICSALICFPSVTYRIKRYGCKTLGELYERLDRYELVKTEKGGAGVVKKKTTVTNGR